jgi:uncharacterized membrane protein YozB (DUF420 family)
MSVTVDATLPPTAIARPVGRYDRAFYGGVAAAGAVTTLVGFGPTYFLRFLDGGPRVTTGGGPFTPLLHVHGALFTAWVLLFVVQTSLISARRVSVHRRVGVFGAVLAAAMIVVGPLVAIALARRGGAPPGIDPLSFLVIPLFDIVMFATFVTTALLKRRDRESHKRLMLLAYASILAAPAARLPGVMPLGPFAFYGLAFLFVIAGIVYDYASRGRLHRVYMWGAPLLAASVPLRLMLSATPAWHAFARFLIRTV